MTITLDDIGLRNGIDQSSRGHDYLHKYEALLASRQSKHLGIILGTRPIAIANTLAEFLPDTNITAVTYAPVDDGDLDRLRPNVRMLRTSNLIEVHRALASSGPYDVLIEDSPNRKSQKRELFRQFFPAVRDGGLYIAEDLHASYIPSLIDDDKEDLWTLVSRLLVIKTSGGKAPGPFSADDRNLAAAMGRVEVDGKLLIIERSRRAATKLRHWEANDILQARFGEKWGRVLSRLPAQKLDSKALVFANDSELAQQKLPNPIHVPDIYVREYNNVEVFPRQVLVKDNVLLPDTFRLGLTARLGSTALKPLNHYFAWAPESEENPEHLWGQYYYLDLEYNRHFGHFMTEVIPRLYAWNAAKKGNPALKVLISSGAPGGKLQPYQEEILRAYGILESDIHVLYGASRVESLISPMPLFHNAHYVHPSLQVTCEQLGRSLVLDSPIAGPRIFVSRKPGMWRECVNMTALEDLFVEHGFEVVYPEELSLREQATLFAHATVAAGYIGSSLYNSIFNSNQMDLIGFVNTAYQSTNEYLFATALGHRMHMFWCDDITDGRTVDVGNRPLAPTNYDYEFNFERDGEALTKVLDSLNS